MKLPLDNPLRYRRLDLRVEILDKAAAVVLNRPEYVVAFCAEMLGYPQEVLVCICLDVGKNVVAVSELFRGTVNACHVHPREVFRSALVLAPTVSGIIVVHNHPSGCSQPSEEDLAMFERLRDAGELLAVPLIDALVIAQDGFWSRAVGHVRASEGDYGRVLEEHVDSHAEMA